MAHVFADILVCAAVLSAPLFGQGTLASWTFDDLTVDAGAASVPSLSHTEADSGLHPAGTCVAAIHASATTVWTVPAGNGSSHSLSATSWSVGDYFEFTFSTLGYAAISIVWDQSGSNTGPRDFAVQYSVNGSVFADASVSGSVYTVANVSWSTTGSRKSASIRTIDLGNLTAVNNASTVSIRLVNTSTVAINSGAPVAPGGTGRVDNFSAVAGEVYLPVELTTFGADVHGMTAVLHWETATEVDNAGWDVERRTAHDAVWRSIGYVPGAGTCSSPRRYAFTDRPAVSGTLVYRLKQIDRDGNYDYSGEAEACLGLSPGEYGLEQNYPNPFNPSTLIRFAVRREQHAKLVVYDILGRQTAILFDDIARDQTVYAVEFNGASAGFALCGGTYFYALHTADGLEVRRMTHVK